MRAISILAATVLGCGSAQPGLAERHTRAFVEHAEPGVLVIALGIDGLSRELQDAQLKIVAKAAHNGPVLILVTSSEQQARLEESCARYDDLCDRLYDGTVRVAVKPHRGPWIRDYGPFISTGLKGSVFVVDAKYDDARRRQGFEYRRELINEARRKILENKIHDSEEISLLSQAREDAFLKYGAELAQLYKDEGESRTRAMDDDAPFYVAEASFGHDRFELVRSPIFLDGGNLFRLEDGACLTTTDTIAKNGGDRILVEHELTTSYQCRRIAFLEPLPGEDIIKHIDMFLMPVSGKKILLATYAPGSMSFQERFSELDGELRALVVQSAIAMTRNKLQLQRLGYDITEVPSLFPRRSMGKTYFPTLLNGIVQVGRDGRRHLLLPDYQADNSHELAVRRSARSVFQNAFGSAVDIQMIEATAPARLQGALHCLTNSVPLSASLFAHSDVVTRTIREQVSKYETKDNCLDQMLGEWQQLGEPHRHGEAEHDDGHLTMVIEKAALTLKNGETEFSLRHTASCVSGLPNEVAMEIDIAGTTSTATLRRNGTNMLTLEFDDGEQRKFVRASRASASRRRRDLQDDD